MKTHAYLEEKFMLFTNGIAYSSIELRKRVADSILNFSINSNITIPPSVKDQWKELLDILKSTNCPWKQGVLDLSEERFLKLVSLIREINSKLTID